MSSTKASSVHSKLLLQSGNLSRLTLWWVTADWWLKARYAKRTIRWLCPSSSRCKGVRGQLQRDRGRILRTMCTCEEIERGTHACKASNWGLSNDGGLRMVNWESQSKTPPPRVWKTDTFIVFYLFVLHSVTCLKTCHFAACFAILKCQKKTIFTNIKKRFEHIELDYLLRSNKATSNNSLCAKFFKPFSTFSLYCLPNFWFGRP